MNKKVFQKIILAIVLSFAMNTASAQEPMIGEIKLFAGNFAPRGWAFCHGQIVAISQNQALFSIIGTTYGGDGRTTFGLPDLRGRVAVGTGQGPGLSNYTWGQKAGAEKQTLSQIQLPAHNHGIDKISELSIKNSPSDKSDTKLLVAGTPAGSTQVNSVGTSTTGGTQPVSIVQPVLSLNYIIALQGVFPSRS